MSGFNNDISSDAAFRLGQSLIFVQSLTSDRASDYDFEEVWESPKLSQDAFPVLRGQKDCDCYIEHTRTYKERKVCLTDGLRERWWWEFRGGKSEGWEHLTSRFLPALLPKIEFFIHGTFSRRIRAS